MGKSINIDLGSSPPVASFATSLSSNGRYLLDQFGNPWFAIGDSAWGLAVDLPPTGSDSIETYFQMRSSQGFNTALFEFFGDNGGNYGVNNGDLAAEDFATYDNIPAFTADMAGTSYPDLTTPNPTFWERIDQVVAMAEEYGITVFANPTNVGAQLDNGGPSLSTLAMRANGATNCQTFGEFVGSRYGSLPNVVCWVHGNDYASNSTDDPLLEALINGVLATAPNTLQSLELSTSANEWSTEIGSPIASLLKINQAYPTSSNPVYGTVGGAYGAADLPVFMGEWCYENSGQVTDYAIRQSFYWTTLVGGLAGYMYGNSELYWFGSGWTQWMTSTLQTQFVYWGNFFKSLDWWKLVPDSTNAFLTAGESSGTTASLAALDPAGSLGVVYCPTTNPTIDMAQMAGEVTAQWYDPTLNTSSFIGTYSNTGSQTFTLPGAHSDGNTDYVLVLTA